MRVHTDGDGCAVAARSDLTVSGSLPYGAIPTQNRCPLISLAKGSCGGEQIQYPDQWRGIRQVLR